MDVPQWRWGGECGECCTGHHHPVDHMVRVRGEEGGEERGEGGRERRCEWCIEVLNIL